MKIKPTSIKSAMAIGLLIGAALVCPGKASAQFVLGSWQDSSDDGWIRVDGSGNSLGSIYAPANDPTYIQQVTNAVTGYPYSLDVKETGYGNVRVQINIPSVTGGLAAWNANSNFNFTFSCGPDTGAGAGYMQLVQFQYNSSGSGFQNISGSWAANGFSESGGTGNNSGGQPIYYFYTGAQPRTQVVTWNYSSVKAAVGTNPSYLQITLVFQTGGGAPTNVYLNNVNLSGAPAPAGATSTYVVDDFSTNGVSNANPTNYDYYNSAQIYSEGQISNVWWNWFGDAFQSATWDGTTDASNNPASGSLKISLNWNPSDANDQFVIWNQGIVNNFYALNISALTYTNFQCDVKFAPGSASDTGNGTSPGGNTTPIFGHLRFGDRPSSYGQDWFGAVDVLATNTGWVHVSIPLNGISDTNLLDIQGLIIGIDPAFYALNLNGASTLWVDNIKFVGPGTSVAPAPPVLGLQKANPGLRIFAGSTVNIYDREGLATADNNQSWVSGTYPIKYSFTLQDYNPTIAQVHLFVVPVNTSGQANMGNAGTPNEYIEYQASNTLWMVINPYTNGTPGNVTASVQWKTGMPNVNPTNNTALMITNGTAIGTWTLAFSSATAGTLTAPGTTAVPFAISDPTVATDFANPAVAYLGIQPNTGAGQGQYIDYASMSITGVTGVNESEDYTREPVFNASGQWANNSALATSIVLATTNTPYWINWTLPAIGYGLGTAEIVTGSTNTPYPYMLPEYFNQYQDGMNIPGSAIQGTKNWLLIPATCLPTVDGSQLGVPANSAFFRLFNPPLSN
jgi:hypothetical protein